MQSLVWVLFVGSNRHIKQQRMQHLEEEIKIINAKSIQYILLKRLYHIIILSKSSKFEFG